MLKTGADYEAVCEHTVTGDALRKLFRSPVTSLCTTVGLHSHSHDVNCEHEFHTFSPGNFRFVLYENTARLNCNSNISYLFNQLIIQSINQSIRARIDKAILRY